MLYVTGDIHADIRRLKGRAAKQLKKGDILLVCGDFGFLWDGSPKELRLLDWLGKRPYQILFVEGTHDNIDLLSGYPEETLYGGQVRRVSGNCCQLLRGECYEIEGKRVFALGGGESTDMDIRVEGETWWSRELPSAEELAHARETLASLNQQVDYIITHSVAPTVNKFLDREQMQINLLLAFLNEISETVQFKRWYFGSCHLDKAIPPKYCAVYQEILPVMD
ncbi:MULTISPECIES: metallophosphoesterase [unclassified Anaerotruncus]|jgi:hypothetical protein|uniref:metallophosphoesterase family protein n=1 Tax=unclassified Anaerotruncus TaxID=2641626 RepID=UPI0003374BE2|nr:MULTISPECIES: metallophosphoesterase [unclassified Anaerotruncus]MCI9161286.1 hypothetical protein [Anaerotruncus sp.]NCE74825.1 hypothetical protein [Anaerotruncus sp. X29]RKJ88824.1 hypothetical protein D7Y41_17085 [Anaerotruncus sp. 1XD22-93]EOS55954.1 hypothetical protein C814_02949 [Anaerotruncus sp. G3(2012)]MCI9236371.1 hypothetical protein [Anaerotruncus sp.]